MSDSERLRPTGPHHLIRACALVAFIVAVWSDNGGGTDCPDPVTLDQRLDQKLLRAVPGVTRSEFEKGVARQNSNFGRAANGIREELFLPSVDEGTRTAFAPLWCRFGPDDRLLKCEAQHGRGQIQRVTESMLADLKPGQSIVAVEARFCVAESREFLANGGVTLQYSLQQTPSHPGPAKVYLRFGASGQFESREVRGH